mmetsp:Transcript_9691/g.30158  ORF Transcript_9691/g.30158 Transcript_9691/m.30158 type:complete len:312 (+) Transcript_9691:570-1505(+)
MAAACARRVPDRWKAGPELLRHVPVERRAQGGHLGVPLAGGRPAADPPLHGRRHGGEPQGLAQLLGRRHRSLDAGRCGASHKPELAAACEGQQAEAGKGQLAAAAAEADGAQVEFTRLGSPRRRDPGGLRGRLEHHLRGPARGQPLHDLRHRRGRGEQEAAAAARAGGLSARHEARPQLRGRGGLSPGERTPRGHVGVSLARVREALHPPLHKRRSGRQPVRFTQLLGCRRGHPGTGELLGFLGRLGPKLLGRGCGPRGYGPRVLLATDHFADRSPGAHRAHGWQLAASEVCSNAPHACRPCGPPCRRLRP